MNKSNKQRILATLLATLACAAAQAQAPAAPQPDNLSFTVTGFTVEGDSPIPPDVVQATLAPFTGKHEGIERLQEAASALEGALRDRGFGFYRVVLPPQDIGGTIKLQMFRFTLGTVSVKGNQVFSNDNILAGLPQLEPGQTPNTQTLARDLAVSNENPSKRVNVTFRQGAADNTIDANVDVTDSRTLTAFVNLNNTGNFATGYGRLTAGVSHTNLFDRDHQGTFTYTTSPSDPGQVHQWGGYYRAPMVRWGGILSGYYSKSSVNSGTVAGLINVTGRGEFAGVQYAHYFAPRGDYRDYLSVGLDDKNFINSGITPVGGGAALFPDYRTRPLTVAYTGRFDKAWGLWGFNVDYAHNLSMGGGNDAASYAANRFGATPSWNAVRAGADVVLPFAKQWAFNARAKAQWSNDELVPGEQFGLGGAQSVRGLDERVISGDSGVQLSAEVWTPPLYQDLRGIFFLDAGSITRHNDAVLGSATLTSIGVGLRWSWGNTLSASLDLGHVLSGMGKLPVGTDRNRAHFALNWRY